jgi:conjugal transfer pilus assembly protein TraB
MRTLILCIGGLVIILSVMVVLLVDGKPKKTTTQEKINLTGIVDESFTEANVESAMTAQQTELESLKNQVSELANSIKTMNAEHKKEQQTEVKAFKKEVQTLVQLQKDKQTPEERALPPELKDSQNPAFWHGKAEALNTVSNPFKVAMSDARPEIHRVSFRTKFKKKSTNYLNPTHYVPSNTSVRAVILGGADADASVNGQSKNNGVMLFKFLEDGALPNGQRSRLSGCRVSANAYGDISSERAFATLYRLSCAHPGEPIIDKEVTGWVFFNGKVGIKGQPLMRDNKVMQWAGVSGALSGIASAAQYAQSVQNIGAFGATSVVPSSNIAPYAAYGGATKASDTLSQYYVKRAEQYHPVIQVGAGNVVTVVFKDGFYLEADEEIQQRASRDFPKVHHAFQNDDDSTPLNDAAEMNFTVPPEVLSQIDSTEVSPRGVPQ